MDDLSSVTWHKSSRSTGNGGDCIEVGAWHKSTRSNGGEGACVEVARNLLHVVAVRDSKDPDGPKLIFAPASWRSFIRNVKRERFEL